MFAGENVNVSYMRFSVDSVDLTQAGFSSRDVLAGYFSYLVSYSCTCVHLFTMYVYLQI